MELLLSFFVSEAIPASSPFHIPFMNGKDDFYISLKATTHKMRRKA